MHRSEPLVVAAGLSYLVGLSVAMTRTSYDVWGALVVIPVYGIIGVMVMRRMFRGEPSAVATVMCWGLLLKLGGAFARYWVGFEAYQGGIDAAQYHERASLVAGRVWRGEDSFLDALPYGTGTEFVEHFTAFLYVLSGASQLAGFITYAFFAYLGLALFVKAAVIAIPGLAARRYAMLCVAFPSIVYWPSSIGKEALMMLGLGVATYGIARLLTSGGGFSSALFIACGLGFAGVIRPHLAGIWVAAALPGLAVALVARSTRKSGREGAGRIGLAFALLAAVVGFAFIASATVRFLAPESDEEAGTTESLTQIFEETARRTSQAGSNFTPPSINSPATWPYASIRTLTRPLPLEARGIAQSISALEVSALLGLYVVSRARLRNLPRLIVTQPYMMFAITAVFLGGLAYSSLANLGILTRQKSLIMPLLVLLPCLPARSAAGRRSSAPTDAGAAVDGPARSRKQHGVARTRASEAPDVWA